MNNLRVARRMKKLTQQKVADLMNIDRTTYTRYESGEIQVDNVKLLQLSEIFGVSIDFLLGKTSTPASKTNQRLIPVLGEVPAGVPIDAVEHVEEYIDLYPNFVPDGEVFGLKVKGKSMEPEIFSGDIVIVLKQDFCSDGDIAVVKVNSEDVTIKRVKVKGNGIMLVPRNPSFEPMFFNSKQIKTLPVTIVGRVIEIRRRL